ncbi:MAG: ribosome silencing factor [candidate division WOR-3 bacterium]
MKTCNNNIIEIVIEKIKEKKCRDLIKLDVGEVTDLTESFIICTSYSDIQSRAVVDAIAEELKKKNKYAHNIEGYEKANWILMDYIDFVIHVFQPEQRSYYNLERLWGDVKREDFEDED